MVEKHSSEKWCEIFNISYDPASQNKLGLKSIFTILNPDGWDTSAIGWGFSFGREQITLEEFKQRVSCSTISDLTNAGREFFK